jgi:hypothetical protein
MCGGGRTCFQFELDCYFSCLASVEINPIDVPYLPLGAMMVCDGVMKGEVEKDEIPEVGIHKLGSNNVILSILVADLCPINNHPTNAYPNSTNTPTHAEKCPTTISTLSSPTRKRSPVHSSSRCPG